MVRFLLNGTTGLLGSNLLLEIIKRNINNLDKIEIIILGRSIAKKSLRERVIEKMYDGSIFDYLEVDEDKGNDIINWCKKEIKYFEGCITKKNLGLSNDSLTLLKKNRIDFFFHIAALTGLRHNNLTFENLQSTNIEGTANILKLAEFLDLGEFCYVGTAYACGRTYENVQPDYVNFDQQFRSPYEITKLRAESLVREFQKRTGIRCRYFRPSVISGRLIEREVGSTTSQFDMFYGWALFLLRYKKKIMIGEDYLNKELKVDLRFYVKESETLNIVPVDWIAKAMYTICINDDKNESYNLVNSRGIEHGIYTGVMANTINIKDIKNVEEMPEDLNEAETFYYRVMNHLTPYITQKSIDFNRDSVIESCEKQGLKCPILDKKSFALLMPYAKNKLFGIRD